MEQEKRGRGRPKKPEGTQLSKIVQVSVTEADKAELAKKAEEAGMALGPYCRELLLKGIS